MTEEAQAIQVDRDAAADVVFAYRDRKNNDWQKRIRDGRCDDGMMVQAFARHRIAAEREVTERAAKMCDKMKEAAGPRLAEKHDDDAAAQWDTALELANALRRNEHMETDNAKLP